MAIIEDENTTGFFSDMKKEEKKSEKSEKPAKKSKVGMSLGQFTEYMRNGEHVEIGNTVYTEFQNGSYVKGKKKGVEKQHVYVHYLTVKSQLGIAKLVK